MNEGVKQKWIEALTSGRYSQTEVELFKESKYCCLGVLTDLYVSTENPTLKQSSVLYKDIISVCSWRQRNIAPSKDVLDWADLNAKDAGDLAFMNDTGNTFEQIAEYINERL